MVPAPYLAINRAICLLPDEHQDERESARAALHHLFREWVRNDPSRRSDAVGDDRSPPR